MSPSHAFADVDDRKHGKKIENLEVVSFPDPLALEYVLCRPWGARIVSGVDHMDGIQRYMWYLSCNQIFFHVFSIVILRFRRSRFRGQHTISSPSTPSPPRARRKPASRDSRCLTKKQFWISWQHTYLSWYLPSSRSHYISRAGSRQDPMTAPTHIPGGNRDLYMWLKLSIHSFVDAILSVFFSKIPYIVSPHKLTI